MKIVTNNLISIFLLFENGENYNNANSKSKSNLYLIYSITNHTTNSKNIIYKNILKPKENDIKQEPLIKLQWLARPLLTKN